MSEFNNPVINAAVHSIKGNLESQLSAATHLESAEGVAPVL